MTLIEAREHLGGGLIQSAMPPHKDKIFWYLDYLKAELGDHAIDVHTGTSATVESLLAAEPDLVIVATGARTQAMPGLQTDRDDIPQAYDLLASPDENGDWQGQHVVVYGGGETGCETAEYLAARGASITLVSRSGSTELARSAEALYRTTLLPRLQNNIRIAIAANTKIASIAGNHAIVSKADSGERDVVTDHIFLAQGRATGNDLVDALTAAGIKSIPVGDTRNIGRIGDAVADAYQVVRSLEREALAEAN